MNNKNFLSVFYLMALPVMFFTTACNNSAGENRNDDSGLNSKDNDGYVKIFDGKSFNGWEGDSTYWKIENATIIGEIGPNTPPLPVNTFLIYTADTLLSDFEVKATYRISNEGNSGINYRSEKLPDIKHGLKGYQADIDGNNNYTGQNYEERGRTTLAYRGQKVTIPQPGNTLPNGSKNNAWTVRIVTDTIADTEQLKAASKSNDWNEIQLIVRGNRLQHFINGTLISDVTDEDTVYGKSSGLMGLQLHVSPAMKVEFKEIYLKKY